MTKRYSILQKKLQELESVLNDQVLSSIPHETPYHQIYSQDIKLRFVFLKSLLSAEIASHPTKRPHHLNHIAQRLTDLEAAFHEWDSSSDNKSQAVLDQVGTVSTCSCTDYCLNDDGEATEASAADDFGEEEIAEKFLEGFGEEKVPAVVEMVRANEEKEKKDVMMKKGEKEKRGFWCGECFRGFVLGAVLMGYVMVSFSGCFQLVERNCCFTPT